jgi:hypothetical protein
MAKADGFPYRRMIAKGHFAGGQFLLEEGFFDSHAARLAASGNVDLLGANSHLSVLIAPLTTVERIVGVIPLVGDVFGGAMVALPVGVNGDIRDPIIVPLARGNHRSAARHLSARRCRAVPPERNPITSWRFSWRLRCHLERERPGVGHRNAVAGGELVERHVGRLSDTVLPSAPHRDVAVCVVDRR